jgi:metal-sulfur cluster biosynthetic enzyme
MITESTVRATLNTIIDPCSSAAGCPAGLDEMGLVRTVDIRDVAAGADVRVVIGVTEPGCLMSAPFATEAYKRLYALPGISAVTVELDMAFDWDLGDMSPDYQQRLQAHRARRRQINIPIVVTQSSSGNGTSAPASKSTSRPA